MKKNLENLYVCPNNGGKLNLHFNCIQDDDVIEGEFSNTDGVHFDITDGIPNLIWPKILDESDALTLESYEEIANDYDKYAALPFITYRSSEDNERSKMIDLLELKSDSRVLEIGCGTGRSAKKLFERLGPQGELFLQEISPSLLRVALEKIKSQNIIANVSLANGSYLPFPDNYFDAAHHFGGINTFSDIPRCLNELARVVKPGGKVVFGDEGLGPWLKNTKMGKIMVNSNPLLSCAPPLSMLPAIASEVRVEYIMMGAFYVVDFRVGISEPLPDYHMMIPSARGGSHWTRYYGQLEGISDEAKLMAKKAREKLGISMHDWLDGTVREAAEKILKSN